MTVKINRPFLRGFRGFTLVELMVTVAVLAILLGVAAPSLVDLLRQNRITSVANEVLGLVQYGRSEAIKRASEINLVLNDPGTAWSATLEAGGGTVIRTVSNIGGAISLSSEQTLTFDYMGRLSPVVGVSFIFTHASDSSIARVVFVEPSGRSCVVKTSSASSCQ